MKFIAASLPGLYKIDLELLHDERGFFARSFCEREFADKQLCSGLKQCNISFNKKKGTLRGMHFQIEPCREAKLVRCTMGSLYDVTLDLRPESPTFGKWEAFELTSSSRLALFVPEGIAHGFQTLEDNTEVFYQMSEFFNPAFARGIRWDDPAFNIRWPIPEKIISAKDQSYPDYTKFG